MTAFSDSLRQWRTLRRFSQLQLAGEANVSARHISFLESGRARPSRPMVGQLCAALGVPLADRNRMLTEAGFAAPQVPRAWDAPDMAPIRAAVTRMLDSHAPYPGLALDRDWTAVQLNAPAQALYAHLGFGPGDNLVDLLVDGPMAQVVENWPEVAWHVAHRLRIDSAALGGVARFDRAFATLMTQARQPEIASSPVIPTRLRLGPLRLSLMACIAQFGTPEEETLQDFKVELYFPMDEETRAVLEGAAA